MNTNSETFTTWNKIAQLYNDKFMAMDLYNETYDFILNELSLENAKVLDVACGPGNITKYLLSKSPELLIDGIDIAPAMIELAKQNNPTTNFQVMDCRLIGELDSGYDAIICGFSFPYLTQEESPKFISDSAKLLNENGLIYISFVEGDPKDSNFKTNNDGDRIFFNYHLLDKVQEDLLANGFKVLKVFEVDYSKDKSKTDMHTILISKKE